MNIAVLVFVILAFFAVIAAMIAAFVASSEIDKAQLSTAKNAALAAAYILVGVAIVLFFLGLYDVFYAPAVIALAPVISRAAYVAAGSPANPPPATQWAGM